uniref:Whey acidic protein n=1 Tax=Soboliphyme baturini TaxID=241478 RepID=A0A183IRK2_9BILA
LVSIFDLGLCSDASFTPGECKHTDDCPVGYECNEKRICCPRASKSPKNRHSGYCRFYPSAPQNFPQFDACSKDSDCPKGLKCCFATVGRKCTVPSNTPPDVRKAGSCPPFFAAEDTVRCKKDNNCPSRMVCCEISGGRYCLHPDYRPLTCPGGSLASSKCISSDQCSSREMCLNGICCLTNKSDVQYKPGFCSSLSMNNVRSAVYDRCFNDHQCPGKMKCCPSYSGFQCELPVSSPTGGKIGDCPNDDTSFSSNVLSCQTDNQCYQDLKCCSTSLGKRCVTPDFSRVKCPDGSLSSISCDKAHRPCMTGMKCVGNLCCPESTTSVVPKFGNCPPVPQPIGRQPYYHMCYKDHDCPATLKCCFTLQGRQCLFPNMGNDLKKQPAIPFPIRKPGTCPSNVREGKLSQPPCTYDNECPERLKCCGPSGKKTCMMPHMSTPSKKMRKCPPMSANVTSSFYCQSDEDCRANLTCCNTVRGKRHTRCNTDSDCPQNMLCCGRSEERFCTAPNAGTKDIKPGVCPKSAKVNPQAVICDSDGQCHGNMKCCRFGVAKLCAPPTIVKPSKQDLKCCGPSPNRFCVTPERVQQKKPGKCPPSWQIARNSPLCFDDSDCPKSQKCCNTANQKVCTSPVSPLTDQLKKPGVCPVHVAALVECTTDRDCEGNQKCCPGFHKKYCSEISSSVPETQRDMSNSRLSEKSAHNAPEVKRGTCPSHLNLTADSLPCKSDGDCPHDTKCCGPKHHKYCSKPRESNLPQTMRCSSKHLCPPNSICIGGYCISNKKIGFKRCMNSRDCPRTFSCVDDYCIPSKVLERKPCEADEDCSAGFRCSNSLCLPGEIETLPACSSDEHCKVGFLCYGNTLCLPEGVKPWTQCSSIKLCPIEHICSYGICIPKPSNWRDCARHERCPPHHRCFNGLCESKSGKAKSSKPGHWLNYASQILSSLHRKDKCSSAKSCRRGRSCCQTHFGKFCMSAKSCPSRPGVCPKASIGNIPEPVSCIIDEDCKEREKCCLTPDGTFCLSTNKLKEKPGYCPVYNDPPESAYPCSSDLECPRMMKCCKSRNERVCMFRQSHCSLFPTEKPGLCPKFPSKERQKTCKCDSECDGKRKCCKNGFKKYCFSPLPSSGAPFTSCVSYKTCPRGFVCQEGRCINGSALSLKKCQTHVDCPVGYSCGSRACLPDSVLSIPSCSKQCDCKRNSRCKYDICFPKKTNPITSCLPGKVCRPGFTCISNLCLVTGSRSTPGCYGRSGCPKGLVCVQELCIPKYYESKSCYSSDECDVNFSCTDGVCIPIEREIKIAEQGHFLYYYSQIINSILRK